MVKLSKYTPEQKGIGKPPKLRGKPGEFYRSKKDNQLYCCVLVYRLKSNPHVWLYELEEREHLGDPSTSMSYFCEKHIGEKVNTTSIIWEPVWNSMEANAKATGINRYKFGDSSLVTAKDLKNRFVKVSSGEVTL